MKVTPLSKITGNMEVYQYTLMLFLRWQKADKNLHDCAKITKHALSKHYHIQNSKSGGQTK